MIHIDILLALTADLFDGVPLAQMTDAEHALRQAAADIPAEVSERLANADKLSDADRETIIEIARQALAEFSPESDQNPSPNKSLKRVHKPLDKSTFVMPCLLSDH